MSTFIQQYLKAMDDLMRSHNPYEHMPRNNTYGKVLEHGRHFTPAPKPKRVRKMKNGACFRNATRLSLKYSDLIYVEGYALPAEVPVAIHHAWVVGPNGIVIDPTWSTHGTEYFGIPIDEGYHIKVMQESGFYSVLDNYKWREFLEATPDQFIFKGVIEHGSSHQEEAAT